MILETLPPDRFERWRTDGRDVLIVAIDPSPYSAIPAGIVPAPPEIEIPGAHRVPAAEDGFEARVESLAGSRYRAVVVYSDDASDEAAAEVAHRLRVAGFPSVFALEGGLAAWRNEVER